MVIIAPVHDHTKHQECEYTKHVISSVTNSKLFTVNMNNFSWNSYNKYYTVNCTHNKKKHHQV